MPTPPIPFTTARTLTLHLQGLTTPISDQSPPDRDAIYAMVERIGCVQIDTLQMVARAQYLTLWSRLGRYDPADFDALQFDPANRRLFETLRPIAIIAPFTQYRWQAGYYTRVLNASGWSRWFANPEKQAAVARVRDRIRENGAMRAGDFEYDGPKRGSWWDWKPAKEACEYLFAAGELMIADRPNFARVYDLAERVVPDQVDTANPADLDEAQRYFVELAVKLAGLCRPDRDLKGAYLAFRWPIKTVLADLVKGGALVPVIVETPGGAAVEMVIHRDNLPLLEQAADGQIKAERTTFLNPFDNVLWTRHRPQDLWGFEQVLETYIPAPKRRWGYFCLPILHKDRLVGRFDPKLERKTGLLRIIALYLEPGVKPDEELVAGMAAALRDFLAFHGAREVAFEKSDPPEFGKKLIKAL